MADMLAHVLGFEGGIGARSEVVDGLFTGRDADIFTYREGKAQRIVALAEREDVDLAASYAYSDSESDLPMLRLVGHPVAVNPDSELARVAAQEDWEVIHLDHLRKRLRIAAGFAGATVVGGLGALGGRRLRK